MVKAGELPGHLIGLVEGGVDRPGQAEPAGDRRERGEDRERVGTSHHVEVVDLAVLLSQPQPFGEEQEVELGPLGGPGQVREGTELDVAAGPGIAPDRGVVHARKVRGEVNLLQWPGHGQLLPEAA
jgi:hypothetical protein